MPTPNTARAPPHHCPAQVVGIIGEAACFPNYEAVLPRENDKVAEFDGELVTAAIRRVALLADERSQALRLQLEQGRLEISSSGGDYGEANEVVDIAYAGPAV